MPLPIMIKCGCLVPRYYCPKCHHDFPEELARCPDCGLDIKEYYDSRDYVDKLIAALRHPEPETPVRAAWLLGKIKDMRAVEPLIELVRETADVYAVRTGVEALGEIGSEQALEFLESIQNHPSVVVSREVLSQLCKHNKK